MNVLVLGVRQFVGRHIVEDLAAAGYRVSVFNRGRTPDELPAVVERLRGDRQDGVAGLRNLADRRWDAFEWSSHPALSNSEMTLRQIESLPAAKSG